MLEARKKLYEKTSNEFAYNVKCNKGSYKKRQLTGDSSQRFKCWTEAYK